MNPPKMPIHIGDYRRDTGHLRAAQHGAYLLLLFHYWSTGALPDDDHQLAAIACMTRSEWKRARPIIEKFFKQGWHHGRVEEDLASARESYEKRAKAGEKGGKAKAETKQSSSNATALSEQPLTTYLEPDLERTSSLRSEDARTWPWRPQFDEFWKQYPHKVGKKSAYKAFVKAMKSGAIDIDRMFFALTAYINKTDDRPWCNPATWLNEGRWDDQPAPEARNGRSLLAAAERQTERLGGRAAAAAYVPGSEKPQPLSLDFGEKPADIQRLPSR